MTTHFNKVITGIVCGGMLAATVACSSDSDSNRSGTGGSAGAAVGTGGTSPGTGGTSPGTGGTSPGTGGTGPVTSGVPGNTVIDDMTDAEFLAMCSALTDSMATATEDMMCSLAGVMTASFMIMDPNATDAAVQAACTEAVDSCLAEPGTTDECTPPEQPCTATVAELEACLNDSIAQTDEMMAAFPACDELTLEALSTMEQPEDPGDPPSCVALNETCPGFM